MPSTIGTQLKNARLDRNLSLKDVFESTHIRIKYLKALEADDFSVMPSPVQGRGFLRLYAQYLNFDVDALLEDLRDTAEEGTSRFSKVEEIQETTLDDSDSVSIPNMDEDESLWERFQHRLADARARPEPNLVDEAESLASTAEASPNHARPEASHSEKDDEPPLPTEESQIIFVEIGKTLRKRREMLSLTFAEVEGHIHLRPRYLECLEKGDFEALPSPVQTRGMLNNYADFLDLDADAVSNRYAEGLQAQRVERQIKDREHLEATPKKKRRFAIGGFVAPDLIFGVGMVALLIAFSVWGLGRIANSRVTQTESKATAPSIAEVLMATPTVGATSTVTPTVMINTPAPGGVVETEVLGEEGLPEGDISGVQILVTIMERTWMRVSVDGEIVFEGRTKPNATFIYNGNETVEVYTSNGAGVRIAYNNKDMGLLGGLGEIVLRLYGARAILTPTVTPTLPVTETSTPTVTLTPTPSNTPRPTGTTE
ncbi:MAG TPA: helix-turn-helix domain-containing protein [Anaerolineales bacterium]|nr:helix-turn-helix domain-containing protein [Anaerolineales bacterium]